jgi:hypothetical protein
MTTYNVSIPDSKNSFFLELLDLLGAKYEKKQEKKEILEETEELLDKRLKDYKNNPDEVTDFDEFIAELEQDL